MITINNEMSLNLYYKNIYSCYYTILKGFAIFGHQTY